MMGLLEYPGGKGGGMNTKRYCEQVLDGVLMDFYGEAKLKHGQLQFQQDNMSCHTSKHTNKWFDDHSIPLFYHLPNSPDPSPIEPVWHELKDIICHHPHPPTTVEELKAAVHTAWEELDLADIDKHILHMPDRVTAIFQARGGHTCF
jgi:hypothetical protein